MIKKIAFLCFMGTLLLLQGCYDDYKIDYEYSATYFARQFPLRTLVDEEGKDLSFEIGAVLGGKYSNKTNENVEFIIQDTLLNNYPQLTKLPDDYYTLASKNITIPSGKFKGNVKVTLDKDKFANDPLAVGKNYALPIQMVNSTADSILENKHFSIIVLRYYNQYHGWYYLKGKDSKVDGTGTVLESVSYSEKDLTENQDMMFETFAKDSVLARYDWDQRVPKPKYDMALNINGSAITIEQNTKTTGITENSGTGMYDPNTRNFTLGYNYKDTAGDLHVVKDTLYYRNTELVLEDWK
jgi:hypothetical protein